ncbi:ATP-binding cassette domain-containing protein [Pseudomonas sp. SDO528_S397]
MSRPVAVAAEPLIRVRDLCKTVGDAQALGQVSLDIFPGEVVALLGAEGAGKSTLVKILGGSEVADTGELWVGGRPQRFESLLSARRVGIVAVHQRADDGIAPGLSVAENLLLDELYQPGTDFWLNRKNLLARAAAIAAGLGLVLPLQQPVERLSPAERQWVVLARAFALQPRLLILDEPTAALSDAEAQRLFGLIDCLRRRGVAILYVSRHLADVRQVADRVIALRDGRVDCVFSARQWADAQGVALPVPSRAGRVLPLLERFALGGFIRNRAQGRALGAKVPSHRSEAECARLSSITAS